MNIYVGNLAFGLTEDELRQFFEEHGSVTSVNLITDRETGNSKGFGFVEMENQSEAEQAISSLDGSQVKGRNLRVNQARPRNERSNQNKRSW